MVIMTGGDRLRHHLLAVNTARRPNAEHQTGLGGSKSASNALDGPPWRVKGGDTSGGGGPLPTLTCFRSARSCVTQPSVRQSPSHCPRVR